MSLYEQFHSDINKEYMFDIIKDIISKDIDFDISQDRSNKDHYLSTFESIFNDNNFEDITEVNKILLDNNVKFFLDKYKPKEKNIQNEYEKLLQERETQVNLKNKESIKNPNNITDINNIIIETNTETDTDNDTTIDTEKETSTLTTDIQNILKDKSKRKKKEKVYRTYSVNSSNRTNINSSRYSYRLDLFKRGISSSEIKKVSKIIIPIEDNYIFSIPILNIIIPELDCNINMQQEKVIDNGSRKYGIYESLENHEINKKNIDRITVEIRDVTNKKYNSNDVLTVNIIEIKGDIIIFTCSNIRNGDYLVDDFIKIINNNSFQFQQLQVPLKIKGITDNIIICNFNEHFEDGTYNNIDMKLMNISNQNILYFN